MFSASKSPNFPAPSAFMASVLSICLLRTGLSVSEGPLVRKALYKCSPLISLHLSSSHASSASFSPEVGQACPLWKRQRSRRFEILNTRQEVLVWAGEGLQLTMNREPQSAP